MPRRRRSNRVSSTLSSATDSRIVRSALNRQPGAAVSQITRVMTLAGTVSSAAVTGNINNVLNLRPDFMDGWALAPLYDEWRLIGARIRFFCAQQNSLTVLSVPVICVFDNDDGATALTTVTGALDYRVKLQFASVWDNNRFPMLQATAYSIADPSAGRAWATTATPLANPCSFKLYANGGTPSTMYLQYTIEAVVQFRGAT